MIGEKETCGVRDFAVHLEFEADSDRGKLDFSIFGISTQRSWIDVTRLGLPRGRKDWRNSFVMASPGVVGLYEKFGF